MIGGNRLGAPRSADNDGQLSGSPVSSGVSVRLLDPGEQPLEVLGVLFKMGCPPELAYDYVEAAVLGHQPEVLVGAEAPAAGRLAEALRTSGAKVGVEPPLEPLVEPEPEPLDDPTVVPLTGHSSRSPVEPPAPAPSLTAFETSSEASSRPDTIVLSDGPPAQPSLQPKIEAVERYIAAYNAGNEPQLVGCLSATAMLSDATGRVLVEGATAIGHRMAEVFTRYPDGRIAVIGRQVAGPWVLDHHSTTYGGGASEETVLCFRVNGGLVDRLVLLTMT
jgi:hypothetical protein